MPVMGRLKVGLKYESIGGWRPGGMSGIQSKVQARNPCLGFNPGRNESCDEAHLGRVIRNGSGTRGIRLGERWRRATLTSRV